MTFFHYRSTVRRSPLMLIKNPQRQDSENYSYHFLFSVEVTELRVGDVVQVTGETEYTSEQNYAVAVITAVYCASQNDDAYKAVMEGRPICTFTGSNIVDSHQHRLAVAKAGTIEVDKALAGKRFIHLIGSANSTGPNPGDTVVVKPNGHMSVVVLRS